MRTEAAPVSREAAEEAVLSGNFSCGRATTPPEDLVDTPRRVKQEFSLAITRSGGVFGAHSKKRTDMTKWLSREISSSCLTEHHVVPIIGKAHVSYLPNRRVEGIGKIARVVDL